jgi:large subunit ribosomal protein L9
MKTIKLLLTENVANLGIVGDVVKVKPGYARNYLVPHGKATTPTEGNIQRLAERRAQVEAELKALRSVQEAMLAKLEGFELTLERSSNEQGVLFGGVSQHDIAEAMREAGHAIEDRDVRIGAQIKRLDSYDIPIVLAADLKTDIKLWIVSDKPMEIEPEEEEAVAESQTQDAAEQVTE